MKPTALLTVLALASAATASFAQTSVTIFRTKDGKRYSTRQRDSLVLARHPVGTVSSATKGDTTFVEIEVYPKLDPRGRAFAQRYKDQKLPDFQLKTLDGKTITAASLRGKVVMLNFWSTTCGPCIAEMPQLNELKRAYKDVVFLAPAPEDAATVRQFLKQQSFQFTILPGAADLFKRWQIDGYPKNFFVDKQGIIRNVKEGTPQYKPSPQAEWTLAVKHDYSPILQSLLSAK